MAVLTLFLFIPLILWLLAAIRAFSVSNGLSYWLKHLVLFLIFTGVIFLIFAARESPILGVLVCLLLSFLWGIYVLIQINKKPIHDDNQDILDDDLSTKDDW